MYIHLIFTPWDYYQASALLHLIYILDTFASAIFYFASAYNCWLWCCLKSFKIWPHCGLRSWKFLVFPGSSAPTSGTLALSSVFGIGALHLSYRHIDRALVSAYVERWQLETNTFRLPFGEMTITLDDISAIIDIPIPLCLSTSTYWIYYKLATSMSMVSFQQFE